MDGQRRKHPRIVNDDFDDVSSAEWEIINMSEQEEDLIYRMYTLVGDRYPLGRGSWRQIWKLILFGKSFQCLEQNWRKFVKSCVSEKRERRELKSRTAFDHVSILHITHTHHK